MTQAADAFAATAAEATGKGADDARHLSDLMRQLAAATPATRAAARAYLLPNLNVTLDLMADSLQAQKTTLASIPDGIRRDWVAADGRVRIEVAPKGDANDNDTLARFSKAVAIHRSGSDGANPWPFKNPGKPWFRAFIEAGIWALLSIAILLLIVLRRISDVLLTLGAFAAGRAGDT